MCFVAIPRRVSRDSPFDESGVLSSVVFFWEEIKKKKRSEERKQQKQKQKKNNIETNVV